MEGRKSNHACVYVKDKPRSNFKYNYSTYWHHISEFKNHELLFHIIRVYGNITEIRCKWKFTLSVWYSRYIKHYKQRILYYRTNKHFEKFKLMNEPGYKFCQRSTYPPNVDKHNK